MFLVNRHEVDAFFDNAFTQYPPHIRKWLSTIGRKHFVKHDAKIEPMHRVPSLLSKPITDRHGNAYAPVTFQGSTRAIFSLRDVGAFNVQTTEDAGFVDLSDANCVTLLQCADWMRVTYPVPGTSDLNKISVQAAIAKHTEWQKAIARAAEKERQELLRRLTQEPDHYNFLYTTVSSSGDVYAIRELVSEEAFKLQGTTHRNCVHYVYWHIKNDGWASLWDIQLHDRSILTACFKRVGDTTIRLTNLQGVCNRTATEAEVLALLPTFISVAQQLNLKLEVSPYWTLPETMKVDNVDCLVPIPVELVNAPNFPTRK